MPQGKKARSNERIVYVCACTCTCEREREREKGERLGRRERGVLAQNNTQRQPGPFAVYTYAHEGCDGRIPTCLDAIAYSAAREPCIWTASETETRSACISVYSTHSRDG